MTQFRVTATFQHRQSAGSSRGLETGTGASETRRCSVDFDPVTASVVISKLPIREWDQERIVAAELTWFSNVFSPQSGTILRTMEGQTGWEVIDASGGGAVQGYVDQVALSIQLLPVAGSIRTVLVVENPVAGFVDNLIDGTAQLKLTIEQPTPGLLPDRLSSITKSGRFSPKGMTVYLDTAEGDTKGEPKPAIDRAYQTTLRNGSGKLTLDVSANGRNRIEVFGASNTFNYGNPFVEASDIGTGFGQIPETPEAVLAEQLENHPRVFMRRPDRLLSGMVSGSQDQIIDNTDIQMDANSFPLVIIRQPSHSIWRLVVDGQPTDVVVSHGTKDLRRPRDIWNEIFVPAMSHQETLPVYDYFENPSGTNLDPLVRTFYESGSFQSWQYVDYAFCLGVLDSVTDDSIYQDRGGGPPNGGPGGFFVEAANGRALRLRPSGAEALGERSAEGSPARDDDGRFVSSETEDD